MDPVVDPSAPAPADAAADSATDPALARLVARVEAMAARYPVDRHGRGDTSDEDLADALEHTHVHGKRAADDLPLMFRRHER